MKRKASTNNLGEMFHCYLAVSRKTLRDVAKEVGLAPPTLMRVTHGREPDATTLLKILNWMFKSPDKDQP